jgi:hypothetical protein
VPVCSAAQSDFAHPTINRKNEPGCRIWACDGVNNTMR